MAKRVPCEIWVLILEKCTPAWPCGYAGKAGKAGKKGHAGNQALKAEIITFLKLARINRTLHSAMDIVCQRYFCQHCVPDQSSPVKSAKHATWIQALGRVFQIVVSKHKSHSGKLLCAGVSNSVRKSLHFSSLFQGTHDVHALCVKLFERGLQHLIMTLIGDDLRAAWLCLPQLIAHLDDPTFRPEWLNPFAFFNELDVNYICSRFDALPDYVTIQGLACLTHQDPNHVRSSSLCRFVMLCGRGLLLGLLSKCFKTNLNDSLAVICHLLKDEHVWQLWTKEWWCTFETGYAYYFEMEALIRHRPELVHLTHEGHSIIGHVLPLHTALQVPDWRCCSSISTILVDTNISYKEAIVDALATEDPDSLEELVVQRGLVVTNRTVQNHLVAAWIRGHMGKIKCPAAVVHCLECLFQHGYVLTDMDVFSVKDSLEWLPTDVSVALLRAVVNQGMGNL